MKLTRRQAMIGATLAAFAAALGWSRARGYPARTERVILSDWQFAVVDAIALRIVQPDEAGAPTARDVRVAEFVDSYVATMDLALRKDLLQCLACVEQAMPLASGYASRFTKLGPQEQDRVLAAMESSRVDLLRGAFQGLKSLVFMGYYRAPATWKILGYDGPIVGRPERGYL